MSEERPFAVGEIAVLLTDMSPNPWAARKGYKPIPAGSEIEITSNIHQIGGGLGYCFAAPGYSTHTRNKVYHWRLKRKGNPPEQASKYTFNELITNLRGEKPLEIEEGEKV